jgi:hypothetical protein
LLLLLRTREVKGQSDNLCGHTPVIGKEAQIRRLRSNVLLLLSLPVPIDGLAQELDDL